MNRKIESAKKLLWHYFNICAEKSNVILDNDSKTEIEGIIDDLIEGIFIIADDRYEMTKHDDDDC